MPDGLPVARVRSRHAAQVRITANRGKTRIDENFPVDIYVGDKLHATYSLLMTAADQVKLWYNHSHDKVFTRADRGQPIGCTLDQPV
jgi:hypothetical protein